MSTAGGWARAAALVLAVLVLDQAVGRFVLGHDLLGGLRDAAQAAAGLARFQAAWPFALLQVAAAAAAAWWGPAAVRRALDAGRVSPPFLAACAVSAVTAVVLAEPGELGGRDLVAYAWGMGLLWLGALGMALWAARRGIAPAVRDWTVYSYAVALVPLTALPSIPLWAALIGMSGDEAAVSAFTLSAAFHVLVAHYWIFERLDARPRPPAAA